MSEENPKVSTNIAQLEHKLKELRSETADSENFVDKAYLDNPEIGKAV